MKIRIIIVYVFIVLILHVIQFGAGVAFDHIKLLNIRADYLIHMAIFFPWMGLIRLSLTSNSPKTGRRQRTASFRQKLSSESVNKLTHSPPFWFLVGILLATIAELIQYWLPYRSFNLMDLLSNAVGVVLGSIVYIDRLFRS